MATNIKCPNCGEDLGKDRENPAITSCGNCGEENIFNQYGDKDELTEEELTMYNRILIKKRGY